MEKELGKAKISVIIPVYNVEKYINECIDSVLSQTFSDLELILIDDGSKDSSGEILDNYKEQDSRITVIHKENAGVSAARNDGIQASSGQYLYIMDSDDYLEPDALETLYGIAVETDADIVMGDHFTFTEDLKETPHHYFSEPFFTNNKKTLEDIQKMILHFSFSPFKSGKDSALGIAPPWTRLVKASLIKDNGLAFDPYVMGIFDDGLFAIEEMEYACSLAYTQNFIYHYRILSSSLIHKYNPKRPEINKRIIERLYAFKEKYNKNESFLESIDCRVIMLFVNLLDTYILNEKYEGSSKNRRRLIKETVKSAQYKDSFKRASDKYLTTTQKTVKHLVNAKLSFLIPTVFNCRKYISQKHK